MSFKLKIDSVLVEENEQEDTKDLNTFILQLMTSKPNTESSFCLPFNPLDSYVLHASLDSSLIFRIRKEG